MADDIDAHLGRRLRRRRRLLGLTQEQLALAVGVRFQQIQKYECGANRISAARLWSLAQALEAPINYFYDGLAGSGRAAPGPTPIGGKAPSETVERPLRPPLAPRALHRILRVTTSHDNETTA